MFLIQSTGLVSAFGFLLQTSERFRRTGEDAFFTGQLIGTFVISRILLLVIEVVVLLIVVKVLKLKAYIGIIVSAILALSSLPVAEPVALRCGINSGGGT